MNCARIEQQLLLYLENELPPAEWQRVNLHLERCDRCAAEMEALLQTQEVVDGTLRVAASAPPALDGRVMAAVRELPVRHGRWIALPSSFGARWRKPTRTVLRTATAAAVLILAAGGFLAGRWHTERNYDPPAAGAPPVARDPRKVSPAADRDRALPELALAALGDDHRKYLADPQPAQVRGPDPQVVSRGLTPALKFPVAAVDLRPEGARLLGGRKCRVQGVPIAFLLYDWGGERVSLYQVDGRRLALPPLREVSAAGRWFRVGAEDGLSYVAWSAGHMNFVMVSGAEPERLIPLAKCASGIPGRT